MFLTREIDIKLCQIYTKTYIYEIWYKNLSFKQIIFSKYATKLKTMINQRSLSSLGLLLLLFEFNNFSFFIDIMDNIIYTPVSRDQNSHQWQCSILITWYRRRHMIMILHCHCWKFWSHNVDVFIILSIIFYIFRLVAYLLNMICLNLWFL